MGLRSSTCVGSPVWLLFASASAIAAEDHEIDEELNKLYHRYHRPANPETKRATYNTQSHAVSMIAIGIRLLTSERIHLIPPLSLRLSHPDSLTPPLSRRLSHSASLPPPPSLSLSLTRSLSLFLSLCRSHSSSHIFSSPLSLTPPLSPCLSHLHLPCSPFTPPQLSHLLILSPSHLPHPASFSPPLQLFPTAVSPYSRSYLLT